MSTIIQVGINEEHKVEAAQLYAKAFERKFVKILGPVEEVAALFSKGINVKNGICAISPDNELIGIAGFQFNDTKLIEVGFKDFINQFGMFRGLFKLIFLGVLFYRKADDKNQLLMDGIVVKEGNRGQGIGKALFEKLEYFSRENKLSTLKLDVIDENPKAKKLYEKIGFVTKRYQKVPNGIKGLIGVSGVSTMVKEL